MGRIKPGKPHRDRPVRETHEPTVPLANWPQGHVGIELTGGDQEECVLVTIHGVKHYLHACTARELERHLASTLEEYNASCRDFGMPPV
ncbi:hypothetical protein ACPCTO_34945 [Streptomyces olivoreticuli]